MEKIDRLYKLSYASLSSSGFFSALGSIWPTIDFYDFLHFLYQLRLVLHRLGNSDYIQYGGHDYNDILTSYSTVLVKLDDHQDHWGNFLGNSLPVADLVHRDNYSLHFLIAHAVENIKWIKYETAWRNAWRPHNFIKEEELESALLQQTNHKVFQRSNRCSWFD